MPVGQPAPTTPVYSSRIVTSDPSTGKIEAVMPGSLRPVQVQGTPVAFRWPVAGEVWRIKNINNTFYLDSPLPIQHNSSTTTMSAESSSVTTINDVEPGDAVINSPTGKIWVLGDPTGTNDFSFDASSVKRTATGTGSITNAGSVSNVSITVTHGLGSVPSYANAVPTFEGIVKLVSLTDTTVTFQFDIYAAAPAPGGAVVTASFGTGTWDFQWIAVA